MRSFFKMTLVLAIGVALCLSSAARAGTIIFQDTFESYTAGVDLTTVTPPVGLNYTAAGGTPWASDATTYPTPGATSDGQFVGHTNIPANGGWGDFLVVSSADQTASTGKVVEFKMDAWITDGTAATGGLDTGSFTSTGYAGGGFNFIAATDGGVLSYYSGAFHTEAAAGTVQRDRWIPVSVLADYGTKTYQATIDGFSFNAPFAGAGSGVGAWGIFRDQAAAASGIYYDNVSINIVPEPSTFLLLATGLVGLLAYAWRKRK